MCIQVVMTNAAVMSGHTRNCSAQSPMSVRMRVPPIHPPIMLQQPFCWFPDTAMTADRPTRSRARTHVLANALHHGSATTVLHNLGQIPLLRLLQLALASTTQTAPSPHLAISAPSHHLCVRHPAEQPRVCVQRSSYVTDRIPLRR